MRVSTGPASRHGGAPLAAAPAIEATRKPRLVAVIAGVSAYAREDLKLRFAAKDADDLALALRRQQGHLYREVIVKPLTDGEVRRGVLLDELDRLEKEATESAWPSMTVDTPRPSGPKRERTHIGQMSGQRGYINRHSQFCCRSQ